MKNSPGAPNYHRSGNLAFEKGWSSERVALPVNSNRRYLNAMPLPFNNGKSLPSKWEDAEKWIFSPIVAGHGGSVNRPSLPPPHRRPKSKSGPLGMPTNSWYLSSFSPSTQAFDGFRYRNYPSCSPFSSSLSTVGDHLSSQTDQGSESSGGASSSGNNDIVSHSADADNCIVRSASVHGWSDVISQNSLPSSGDEKIDSSKDASVAFSPGVSRRDMATQMSPRSSPSSSSKGRSSFTSSPFVIKTVEVRDVQVDDRATVKRWSKKYGSKRTDKSSLNIKVPKSKALDVKTSSWDVKDTEKCLSKLKRKEGKITAWENLQKAKAEAEIRKLEMKLEKLRSTSMAKIMKKLKAAQTKAEGMRHVVSTSQTHPNSKVTPVARKTGQFISFSSCFTFRAS